MKKLIAGAAALSVIIFASSAYAAEPVKMLMKNQTDVAQWYMKIDRS